jgi:hypothetical protein
MIPTGILPALIIGALAALVGMFFALRERKAR